MLEIVNRPFAATDLESLSVTLNIRCEGLECLTNKEAGAFFRSQDQPADGETEAQVRQQIDAVYDRIKRKPPEYMASLAARCPLSFRYDNKLLNDYGKIVLLMDWVQIAPDIVIFNGDVKNLGAKLIQVRDSGAAQDDWLMPFTFDKEHLNTQVTSTGAKLDELWKKLTEIGATPPRIVGKYCEARLFRGLRPTDVLKAFVPDVARCQMPLVEELKRLNESMSRV